jgi:hypothetical protein
MPVLIEIVIIFTSLLKSILVPLLDHQMVQSLLQFCEGVKVADFLQSDAAQGATDLVCRNLLDLPVIQPQSQNESDIARVHVLMSIVEALYRKVIGSTKLALTVVTKQKSKIPLSPISSRLL